MEIKDFVIGFVAGKMSMTPPVKIVPWATGTDEEIAAMISAAHTGKIDLHDDGGWNTGDIRTITINAFTDYGGRSFAQQNIDIVITSFDDYMDCGCVMQFDFKDSLAEPVQMSPNNTTVSRYATSIVCSQTLPVLAEALPTFLKNSLIDFSCIASYISSGIVKETVENNKLALRSWYEMFGTSSSSVIDGEKQIDYYKMQSNRIKKLGHSGEAKLWWLRSIPGNVSRPDQNYNSINASGDGTTRNSWDSSVPFPVGVAPFGCV